VTRTVHSGSSRRKALLPLSASLLGLVLVLAFMAGLVAGCGSSVAGGDDSSPAPAFSGKTLDGLDVSLDMYRGKPLVLAFMASW
jgi:hypothetical protein